MNAGKFKVKIKLFGYLPALVLLLTLPLSLAAQKNKQKFDTLQQKVTVTQQTVQDTLLPIDTVKGKKQPRLRTIEPIRKDSIKTFSLDTSIIKISKNGLTAPVTYAANDSAIYYVDTRILTLYGAKANVVYAGNTLAAPQISYSQQKNMVTASIAKDSSGKILAYPYYESSDLVSVSDSIFVNLKTGKGITKGSYSKQGEMFVYAEKIKREDTVVFYGKNARFTTCNLDTPHFGFVTKKVKFVSEKWAYAGLTYPMFEDVPLPIGLPFAIFPLKTGIRSGLLAPSFEVHQQYGLGLEGLGYYKIINPYWDVTILGSLYSYGGWQATVTPVYYKKYKYRGNFSLSALNTKLLDEPSLKNYRVTWAHNLDSKAKPGLTFNANVNASTSKYNSVIPNSPILNVQNMMGSSVAYARSVKNKPYSYSINFLHSQNNNLKLITLDFPTGNFNLETLYPFRKKKSTGTKWYENLGVGYLNNYKSTSSFYDTARAIGKQLSNNLEWGASNSFPITLSLPPISFFTVMPGVSYSQNWYGKKNQLQWNSLQKKIDTNISQGFYLAHDISFSISMNTKVVGMMVFKPSSKIKAIRHEIRPNISFSYKPDLSKQNYQTVQVDTSGNKRQYYKYLGPYGAIGSGRFGGMSFGLDNVVSMKKRSATDSSAKSDKVINLLDRLNISSSFNFLQDSFQLGRIALSGGTNFFEKVSVNFDAGFNPYLFDFDKKRDIEKTYWTKNPISLGRLERVNISMSGSVQGGKNGKSSGLLGKRDENAQAITSIKNSVPDELQTEALIYDNAPTVDFNIPWNVNFTISFGMNYIPNYNKKQFDAMVNSSFNLSGGINLTPKWKLSGNAFLNFNTMQIEPVSLNIVRDMHCWQMSISISPVGRSKYFSINIAPTSSLLRDLKINRTRSFTDF